MDVNKIHGDIKFSYICINKIRKHQFEESVSKGGSQLHIIAESSDIDIRRHDRLMNIIDAEIERMAARVHPAITAHTCGWNVRNIGAAHPQPIVTGPE